jgi:hypothetical protein
VGVLFYLKPDGQYILADDDGMAVFLFIVIMLSVMIDSGRSFLLKLHSIIINKAHSHDSGTK